ncbi:uncharacterized protein Z520_02117 [Fonsecaea multimorphosa CBS 102226]|uniref:Uncharacterized protein n=1 Tax=Fonsecaea multimorphosa CBS 102226 TaxID=1442371 RepID=A0A0D2KYU2_9EURO|nr:uncharacterized protein Z520_02117 [Fonsecaea multimorphosa CBS 102226]KIY01979.1 hypothetical protein Z520_02117 [Fonsecaea multimorphosa CBS 102226]
MCSWLPEFNGPRVGFDYENENITYLTRQRKLGNKDDWVELCMLDLDDTDSDQSKVDVVRNFLQGSTERTIRPDDAKDGSTPFYVAWLDERDYECGPRTYCNPLTAEGLSQKLSKPRFRSRTHGSKNTSGASILSFLRGVSPQIAAAAIRENAATINIAETMNHKDEPECIDMDTCVRGSRRVSLTECLQQEGDKPIGGRHFAPTWRVGPSWAATPYHEPDAARRLVFITDLDAKTAAVLMETASYHQARPLRHALYHHITNNALVSVNISPKLPSNFELAFHMPFYAWRNASREDHRRFASGEPLRETEDVSFLNQQAREVVLCQAHFTCVIFGSDDRHWVAYCFADTYFDGQDDGRETVLEYHQDRDSEDGMNADPLTYGNIDADVDPIWNPRKYFLTICRYRLQRVGREWAQVVMHLVGSFASFDKVRTLLPYHSYWSVAIENDNKFTGVDQAHTLGNTWSMAN